MADPLVSVVIVNWNHGHLLAGCLDALLPQAHLAKEILIIDNGSADGSAEQIARDYPSVQLLALPENRGFCAAFNLGARHSTGELVLSLNPDVQVKSGFLLEIARVSGQGPRIGIVAPKLLRPDPATPALLDSTGLFVDRRRRPYDRGQGEPDQGQYDRLPVGATGGTLYAFGACGAAALYRRTMLDDLALDGEYFDEDFFAYYEDADLAWRAHSRGWRCAYAPRAVATHLRGLGDTLRKQGHASKGSTGPRLALRNRYLMAIKNDHSRYFLADLPRILAAELPRLAYVAVTRPKVLLAVVDLIRLWPSAARKRRLIRAARLVDDKAIRAWFTAPAQRVGDPGP